MKAYRMDFTMDSAYLDKAGRVRPGALLYFAQEAATEHCRLLGAEQTGNLFWAVIRIRTEIVRLPQKGETITLETWPLPTTRTAYPRVAMGYDREGNLLFAIHSLWVLMDKATRALVLPGKSGVTVEGWLQGNEPAAPGGITLKELNALGSRQVAQADLDENRHMNNTRYLDWVFEALPAQWASQTPRDFTVCYLNEARFGQELFLFWGQIAPNSVQFEGHRPKPEDSAKQERIFAVSVNY